MRAPYDEKRQAGDPKRSLTKYLIGTGVTKPKAPTNFGYTAAVDGKSVTIRWINHSPAPAAKWNLVWYSEASTPNRFIKVAPLPAAASTYTAEELKLETAYLFRVAAYVDE